MARWSAASAGIRREGILGLRHAYRQTSIALLFPKPELVPNLLIGQHLVGTIDALRDGFDLLEQGHLVGIQRRILRLCLINCLDNLLRQVGRALRTIGPVPGHHRLRSVPFHVVHNCLHFGVRVRHEMIDCDDGRNAKLLDVLKMPAQVRASLADGLDILLAEIASFHATVHL